MFYSRRRFLYSVAAAAVAAFAFFSSVGLYFGLACFLSCSLALSSLLALVMRNERAGCVCECMFCFFTLRIYSGSGNVRGNFRTFY